MAKKKKDELEYKLHNTVTNVARRCEQPRAVVKAFVEPILNSLVDPGVEIMCHYCDEKLTLKTVSFDHILPLSRGGAKWQSEDGKSNIAICCVICNKVKGSLTEEEYNALLLCIKGWEEAARLNVTRRLRLGGMFFGRFKGRSKGRRWKKRG